MWTTTLTRGLAMSIAGSALAGAAVAQQSGSAANRGESELAEVIVTAQKRAESLQNVPITMQAYTAGQLQAAGISQVTDIARLAPNLNVVVQNSLSQHIVIRGVGTNEFFGNAPSSVGTYMDEVTMNSSYMSTLGLFDMERVEILRGPQNSLFGRNTTGGAVNYITRMPKVGAEGIEGFGLLTYGRHDLAEVETGISIPLGSTVALRLAGVYHTRNGIWNNLDTGDGSYGDETRYSERATLVWEPSQSTRLTASIHSARFDGQAQPQKMAGAYLNNPPLRANDLAPFAGNIDWKGGNLNTVGNVRTVNVEGFDRFTRGWQDVWVGGSQVNNLHVDGGYVKVTHDFGQATVTSISAFDKTHGLYEEDNTGDGNISGAGTPGVTHDVLIIDMDQRYEQYTQELRLASNDDKARFRWITGVYYLHENSLLGQDIRFGSNGFPGAHPSAVGITPPALFDVIPNPYGNTVSFSIADLKDRSASVYGQTDFHFTSRITGTLGLRYTHDKKSNPAYYAGAFVKPAGWNPAQYIDQSAIRRYAANLGNCVPKTDAAYIPFQHCADNNTSRPDINNDEVGGKAGLQYRPSEAVMVYGSYSRGFKSGRFDMEFLHTDDTPFPQRPLKPEILDVFELGFKSTLLDRSLVLNGAIFYNIWKNQQVFNVGVGGPEFNNLPESRIAGAELEANWVPAQHWLVTGSLGLLNTRITDVHGIDFDLHQGDFQKGHELPLAPKVTANAGLGRTFNVERGVLGLHTDLRYQGRSKVKYSPQVPIDEYDARFEIDARATYAFGAQQQYEVAVFGDNLTSARYCVEIQDLRGVSGSFYCVPNEGEPRWGVQGRMNF
ncbi:MAG: TonB-dependent receptor-like protein [Gammaproteobacteria bacterium]|jgi:iron complex outermembrane receptor protein|nr:TonB-dependent receptor-like protein [Gammaproteobacteria bacterium]